MLLGCHNVIMSNHSTFVLAYLFLQGYDVSGHDYRMRLIALTVGAAATAAVLYRNHRKMTYKRSFRNLFEEFDLTSARTRWQIRLTLGVSSVMAIATPIFGLGNAMFLRVFNNAFGSLYGYVFDTVSSQIYAWAQRRKAVTLSNTF